MTGADIRNAIKERFPDAVLSEAEGRDMDTVVISVESLRDVSVFLRDDPELNFDMLTDLTAVDWHRRKTPRYELVAMFWSTDKDHRIRLKAPITADSSEFDTLSEVYGVANWLEREIFDMFGLKAKGHPNLRRMLTHEGFEGHPLRKDYPVNRRQPIRPPVTDLLTKKPYQG